MTNKEKLLLLQKDLCARLPYGVMCRIKTRFVFDDGTVRKGTRDEILDLDTVTEIESWYDANEIEKLKPYLRPMSSMTEKEVDDFYTAIDWYGKIDEYGNVYTKGQDKVYRETFYDYTDWLNSHHFDYRGLIENGLAIEAPEGMYNN